MDLSFVEIGVPVKPIYVAFGRLFLIILAEPIFIFPVSLSTFSASPYCPLCASSAITTIFLLSDKHSKDSANFCMVVNMIPFAFLPANKERRCSLDSA